MYWGANASSSLIIGSFRCVWVVPLYELSSTNTDCTGVIWSIMDRLDGYAQSDATSF